MSASLNFLRSGFKSYNYLLRPYSTIRSTLINAKVPVAPTLAKKPSTILFAKPAQQPSLITTRLSHNAPKQWTAEKGLTIVLLGLIPTALFFENPIVDSVLSAVLVTHIYWGLESICTDYDHGSLLPRLAFGTLYAVVALTLIGLLYFNYKDIGISKAVKKVWTL